MKKCPFCMKEIHDDAVRCTHCGELLEATALAPSREKAPTLSPHVEPSEFQKKVFKTVFVALIVILAAIAVVIFLGSYFGWLPEWEPMQK